MKIIQKVKVIKFLWPLASELRRLVVNKKPYEFYGFWSKYQTLRDFRKPTQKKYSRVLVVNRWEVCREYNLVPDSRTGNSLEYKDKISNSFKHHCSYFEYKMTKHCKMSPFPSRIYQQLQANNLRMKENKIILIWMKIISVTKIL